MTKYVPLLLGRLIIYGATAIIGWLLLACSGDIGCEEGQLINFTYALLVVGVVAIAYYFVRRKR